MSEETNQDSPQVEGQTQTEEATSESVNGDATQQQPDSDTNVVLFSQDEVNRINKRTKEQAEKRAVQNLLEKFGLENTGDLEAIVQAKREADEAAKTELQRAQEAKDSAIKQAENAIKAANETLIKAAFLAEAGKVQAQHPQDAHRLADLSAVEITDSGEVTGVEDAVKALVESGRLSIAGKPKPPKLNGGAGSGERTTEKSVQLTQEEIQSAQKMGVSLEDYAKNK